MKNRTNPALWYVECAVTAELHLLLFLFYLSIIVLNKSHHGVHTFEVLTDRVPQLAVIFSTGTYSGMVVEEL